MKAQRRHELQTNELAKVITGAPSAYGRYGGRVLLVVVAAVLVFVLVRYRINTSRESARLAREHLASARSIIAAMQVADLYDEPPHQAASRRLLMISETTTALEEAARLSDEPQVLSEALLARGDLNWTLATLADIPGAATQPTLRTEQTPEQLIAGAEESYAGVLNQYPEQTNAVVGAHFGLAGIAENRGQWDEAKKHYQAIIDNKDIAEAFRGQAKLRMDNMGEWSQPVLLVPATTQAVERGVPFVNPSTAPTTQSTTTRPAA